jgi:imidazoleglycerol phosphate dehydratase HisB
VIGSRNSWVEACVLEAGAREIVTLEYGAINSKHPQLKTMIPSEFRRSFLENKQQTFHAVVTFSSVEHTGLGILGYML